MCIRDSLSIINSLADIPSALFGGPPIEAIISGTAGAPWPVACGVVFMLVTGILVLLGLVGRLGKYLPAQSISGFLLIIGLVITFVPNLSTVAASDGSVSGFVALGVGNDRMWERFCDIIGHPELREDPRYKTNVSRFENYEPDLKKVLTEWCEQYTKSEIESKMCIRDRSTRVPPGSSTARMTQSPPSTRARLLPAMWW